MVTRKKSSDEKKEKKSKVRVEKLNLNRETIKDLSIQEKGRIKGGAKRETNPDHCETLGCGSAAICDTSICNSVPTLVSARL